MNTENKSKQVYHVHHRTIYALNILSFITFFLMFLCATLFTSLAVDRHNNYIDSPQLRDACIASLSTWGGLTIIIMLLAIFNLKNQSLRSLVRWNKINNILALAFGELAWVYGIVLHTKSKHVTQTQFDKNERHDLFNSKTHKYQAIALAAFIQIAMWTTAIVLLKIYW